MHNLNLDLDSAIQWLKVEHERLLQQFLSDYREAFPHSEPGRRASLSPYQSHFTFGSYARDSQAKRFVDDIAELVRGWTDYCFLAPRYFGGEGKSVRARGWVELMPKRDPKEGHQ